ncbi:MAG: S8 family serine peptidase [Bacteroidota bacterium]
MKHMLFVLTVAMTLVACQPEELRPPQNQFAESNNSLPDMAPPQPDVPLTEEEIELAVIDLLEDEEQDFSWDMVNDHVMWSAAVAGDGFIHVGYKPAYLDDVSDILSTIDVESDEWTAARQDVIDEILAILNEEEPEEPFTESSLQIKQMGPLPIMELQLSDYGAIASLRRSVRVRFVEPVGYFLGPVFSGIIADLILTAACALEGDPNGFWPNTSQYSFFNEQGQSFQSLVSWHLSAHRVPQAWDMARGDNITIGVLDTGLDFDQELMQAPGFFFGPSANRTLQSEFTYNGFFGNQNDSDDRCYHGTSIGGQIAGPVNDDGGITGVAYQANLRSIRVGNDVHINTRQELDAYVLGLTDLADDPNVRVINTSLGALARRSTMEDAVNYANAQGKILVCAAGSVGQNAGIFPAKFEHVIAATAVRHRPVTDPFGTNLQLAGSNAQGDFVDFAVYLQQNDGDWALGMPDDIQAAIEAKGSSSAAAMVSGIAALIWSANPSLTKENVLQIMRENASYWGNENPQFGWGVIDAEAAVLAAQNFVAPVYADIVGPQKITSSGNQTWNAQISNASGNVTYSWKMDGIPVGGNSPNLTHYLTHGQFCSYDLELTVTTSSGQNTTETKTILCW